MTTAQGIAIPAAERLIASLPQALIVVDPALSIASVNPAAEQFLGQSLRRLVGAPLSSVLLVADARVLDRLVDFDTPVSAREVDVAVPGKGARKVDIHATPVADGSGFRVITIQDNSPTDALGDDAGAMGEAFLRGPEILAHEIKNPLAGIRGAAQLLARKIDEGDKPLTELIKSEVDRIADLIGRMQNLSSTTPPPLTQCNLHEAARRAIDVIRAAKASGSEELRIVEEFDPSLPPVLGSAEGLVQVIINLISNASEASADNEEPRVIVRTRFASGLQLHHSDNGEPVRLPVEIRISDNGPGVDPAMRDHIFEPFVTTKKTGQGLGLPLVRKLVRDMNGRITHERNDETGMTHFRVHLPLAADRTTTSSRKNKQ